MPESSAVLWRPDPAAADASQMREFQRLMGERHDAPQGDYQEFWRWTIENLDVFWEEIIEFAGIVWERGDGPVREGDTMPDVRWFPGARINYAENILRWSEERGDEPAIIGRHEDDRREVLTWNELRGQVGALAARLREWGVQPGDTVAAVLPNLPQTAVALLATAAVGAVWSVVNTDFGVRGIEDRFAQIEPKVLFTADSLLFNGKHMSLTDAVPGILEVLPTVERHVLIEQTGRTGVEQSTAAVAVPGGREVPSASFDALVAAPEEPVFERVEFSHPLWVLYSSGTTGKPKGIVHGHGGVVVEMNRANILQYDVRPG